MDIAGRIGGDEMIVIFPETSLDEAKLIAQRILSSVAEEKIAGIEITFSAGLYQYQSETAKELIEKADQLMYKAKRKNKNQIIF